jgi:D-alanyl-lipoteichoic acid acyltransferase DltB (MBOAT superfamily)
MIFNSLTYLCFLTLLAPLVVFGAAPVRRAVLLLGSLLFYAFWRVDFTLLMLFSASVDYVGGLKIHATQDEAVRKRWLVTCLLINFGLLAYFKYTYFLVGSAQGLAGLVGLPFAVQLPEIILPLGISFYTFHSVSYSMDVYRRQEEPIRDYGTYVTFVTFWPAMMAGPILRINQLVPQLQNYRRPERAAVVQGLEELLQGLFKKVVLADTLGEIVDYGFAQPPAQLGTLDVWTLAFAFGMQIYFDFAGYSRMAQGSARVMGFDLPQNFNWPYLAVSPRDFWQRWHISLSAWIRDYLYLPLMGTRPQVKGVASGGIGAAEPPARASGARRTLALLGTWFIMGLWHGANWTFALWGLWHAGLILTYRATETARNWVPIRWRGLGGWLWTTALAMLGWVYFRAATVADANTLLRLAFDPAKLRVMSLRENQYLIVFLFFIGMLGVAAVLHWQRRHPLPLWLRFTGLTAANLVMSFSVILMLREIRQFIYFQF